MRDSSGQCDPLTAELPLWQAALLGCGVVTGVGAVRNTARVRVGRHGCGDRLRRSRTPGDRRARSSPVPAASSPSTARPRSWRAQHDRGRPTWSTDRAVDAVAAVLELVPGGVDYAFEVVGLPATIREAWDMIRPGGSAIVVGLAPKGAEVSLPALDLLSEKNLRGCYYGSANVADELPALMRLAADGRLSMGEVVSHVIESPRSTRRSTACVRRRRSLGDRDRSRDSRRFGRPRPLNFPACGSFGQLWWD